MSRFINIKTLAAALVLDAMGFVGTQDAAASDCHAPRCYYKTIVEYKAVRKACVDYVTRYDHCGKPYLDKVVTYKIIQVPVERVIKVCY